MARSLKKGPYIDERLIKKMQNAKPGAVIKTWTRDCTIIPEMVGFSFGVYNGKQHTIVKVAEDMVGHKLGEFSPTTKFIRHGGKLQKELEKAEETKEAAKMETADKGKPAETKAAAK